MTSEDIMKRREFFEWPRTRKGKGKTDCATAFDLSIVNIFFEKRINHFSDIHSIHMQEWRKRERERDI